MTSKRLPTITTFGTALVVLAGGLADDTGSWDFPFAPSGLDQAVLTVSQRDDGQIIFGGRFGGAPGGPRFVTAWPADGWRLMSNPGTNGVNSLVTATVTIGTNTYFGGEFGSDNGGTFLNGIARWEGSRLHALESGPLAGVQG